MYYYKIFLLFFINLPRTKVLKYILGTILRLHVAFCCPLFPKIRLLDQNGFSMCIFWFVIFVTKLFAKYLRFVH